MEKIKKGKIVMTVTIGIACFVLMTVMFMQFKIVNQTDITSIENMRKADLTTELASWKQKYDETSFINATFSGYAKSFIRIYTNFQTLIS